MLMNAWEKDHQVSHTSLNVVWQFSYMYRWLGRSWHTDFDGRSLRIHDHDTGLTAGVTGQQGMFALSMHLIPLPLCPGVRVLPFISLTCNAYFCFEIDHCCVHIPWPFHCHFVYLEQVHVCFLQYQCLTSSRSQNIH
jgi:hypothetical protein